MPGSMNQSGLGIFKLHQSAAIKRVSTETFMVIDKVIMTFVFLRQTL